MPRALVYAISLVLLITSAYSQRLRRREALVLAENSINYLKTSDTAAFLSQWVLDSSGKNTNRKGYTALKVKQAFTDMSVFLDMALAEGLTPRVRSEKLKEDSGYSNAYKITIEFRLLPDYSKVVSFYTTFINGRWRYFFTPGFNSVVKIKDESW
jgi:hypothetical protein